MCEEPDIYLNSDYSVSIIATNVDPAVREGTPAAKSRKYAVATQQIVKNALKVSFNGADPSIPGYPTAPDPSIAITNAGIDVNILSYNAELFKQLSPEMKEKFQALYPSL